MKIYQDVTLARNIRDLRHAAKMTQEQIVARMQIEGCEITQGVYSKLERGKHSVRTKELDALLSIFGVDHNTLFAKR